MCAKLGAMLRRCRAEIALAAGLALLCMLVPAQAVLAAPGDVATPYDGHDTVEVTAPASTAAFSATRTYDSSAFTTTPSERDDNGTSDGIFTNKTGCGASPPYWGGRSSWVRFNTPVKGQLRADVSTGGYDPFVVFWRGPNTALGTTQFANLENVDCNAVRTDSEESVSFAVEANAPMHVEVLGFCDRATYWTVAPGCIGADLDAKSPGGSTSVTLSFQCTNTDADAVCDTLDPCPTVIGDQNGCPDRDLDGVLDTADACPDVAGTDAGCPADLDNDTVPNASDQCVTQAGYPPSGCPDGDGDGVVYPVDSCPTAKGIPGDGCPDQDGDGVSDRVDACPTVFGTSKTGCLAVLGALIRWQFSGFRLTHMVVQSLPGAKIVVRCTAKRLSRCPFR